MEFANQETPGHGRNRAMRRVLFVLAVVGIPVAVLLLFQRTIRTIRCGFGATYAEGTIVALPPAVIAETNPHSALPDYRPGRTLVIKLDTENGREIPAEPEQGPSSRRIGERVQVCYDPQHAEHVHIIDPR